MRISRQNELIRYAQNNISPFNPNTMDEQVVYARLAENYMDDEELNNQRELLLLELHTPQSIQSDYEFFVSRTRQPENYIPCAYTFTVFGEDDSREKTLCNELKALCRNNNGWIKGKLSLHSQIGVRGNLSLSFGLVDKPRNEGNLPLNLSASFTADPNPINPADHSFSQILAISESLPRGGTIESGFAGGDATGAGTQGGGFPDIPGWSPTTDPDILIKPYKVTVYKVGHGNAITIEKNNRCILFDCGINDPDTNYLSAKNDIIDKVKPDIIIISHWHKDHYGLLPDINTSKLKMIIAPADYLTATYKGADTTIATLLRAGVHFIDLSRMRAFPSGFLTNYGFERINLFLGRGLSDPIPDPDPASGIFCGHTTYTRHDDDTGIILSLQSNRNYIAILPGDCSYYSWPVCPELDLHETVKLVASHHGGHAISQKLTTTTHFPYTNVYISSNFRSFVNLNNGYGTTQHRSFLSNVLNRPTVNMTENLTKNSISFKI